MRWMPALVVLTGCGSGAETGGELTLSSKSGTNAQVETAPLREISSGHQPNNRGVPFGLIWFATEFELALSADLQVEIYEPPAKQTYTVVVKQFTQLQPGDATVSYTESGNNEHRGWHAPSGTLQVTEASGGTVSLEFTLAMEPDPADVFGPGTGTFELKAHVTTTSYELTSP